MLSVYWRVTTLLAVALLCCPSAGWGQEKQLQDPPTAAGAGGEQAALAIVPTGQVAVLYQNAEVMIVSHRAPLIEVLREVCRQIGAELDAPPELDVPILGVFGPGPARDVLTDVMGGSHFNLAMAGSPEDPNAIVRIVILPKSADSAEKTTNGSDAPPAQDSLAQATEQPGTQATEPPIPSTPTASDVEARMSQVRELFAQAQGELAQVAGLANLDMDSLLKEAEAQAKASAAEDDLDAPPPPKSSAAAGPINHPRGRRHRH